MLPGDRARSVDLSPAYCRILRAIVDSWTEMMHSDVTLADLAEAWAAERPSRFLRLCPLCEAGPGTPRHTVMACTRLGSICDHVRNIEAELFRHFSSAELRARAAERLTDVEVMNDVVAHLAAAAQQRWLTLSA